MGGATISPNVSSDTVKVPSRTFKKGFFLHPREKLAARGVVVALVLVFIVHVIYLVIYFGALWNIEQGFHKLPTALVSADVGYAGQQIGPLIVEGMTTVPNPFKPGAPLLDWEIIDSGDIPSLQDLQNKVDDQTYWFAVYIPADFTENLFNSIVLHMPYLNNISVIFDEGRQYTTETTGKTMITTVLTQVNYQVTEKILTGSLAAFLTNFSAIDLAAVVTPARVNLINLHPSDGIGPAFSTYMGFFVSWLTAVLIVNIMRRSLEPIEREGTPFWTERSRAVLKGVIAVFASLIVGLLQSAITSGFGLDFYMGFGNHFGVCFLSALTYIAVTAAIVNLIGDAGLMLITVLLYLQIASSASIYSNELMNNFYFKLGPVFPIYHSVQACRTVSFGSANNLSLNIGVLFVWLIVCASTSYLAVHFDVSNKLKKRLKKRAPNLENAILATSNHKIERLPTTMIKFDGQDDDDEDEDEKDKNEEMEEGNNGNEEKESEAEEEEEE